jgi:hypothetical protein
VRTYRLAAERLKLAEDWLGRQRRMWERRLDQLDAYLMTMKEGEARMTSPAAPPAAVEARRGRARAA